MNTLRQVIRGILAEKAVTVQQASSEGLALMIDSRSNGKLDLVLYRPDVIKAMAKIVSASDYPENVINRAALKSIVGTVTIRKPVNDGPCNGAWEVGASAAEPGYGPMLYDIAMTFAPEGRIMSDRDSVSNDAKSVWSFYKNRRKDVDALPLDDIDNPKTDDPNDDCAVHPPEQVKGKDTNPLNFAYEGGVDGNALMATHSEFMASVSKLFKGYNGKTLATRLFAASTVFFGKKYSGQGID